jgi:choline dehydrogenase-like flavoprotein
MGKYSNNSTVDKNFKIHKYSNIYVIGSDIFKQPGITNPALTIMTLAYKLAVELKKKYKIS